MSAMPKVKTQGTARFFSIAWRAAVVLGAAFMVLLYLYGFIQEMRGNYRISPIRKEGVIKGQLQPPIPGQVKKEEPAHH
jgi:hypothetical protein